MKVHFQCGYISNLGRNQSGRHSEDYWDAYFYCWAVKMGAFKRSFDYHSRNGKKTRILKNNFNIVRQMFGRFVAASAKKLGADDDTIFISVPSKDGVKGTSDFRSSLMLTEALSKTEYAGQASNALVWKVKVTKAHEGGQRHSAALKPLMIVVRPVKGSNVILVDDLISTGGSMLAARDLLEGAGAKVLGAVTCGKTVYDFDTPHFGDQVFDLTRELSDFKG